jgi:hypothetical protein
MEPGQSSTVARSRACEQLHDDKPGTSAAATLLSGIGAQLWAGVGGMRRESGLPCCS